jgi:putative membrane protein
MSRSIKDYLIIGLKGMAMGAADVVPGVSGGTIAFISGIYEELIDSIESVGPGRLADLRRGGLKKVWTEVNGNFLLSLFTGIFVSVFSLSKILSSLLENHPVLVWSFFFGLVLASIFFVVRAIDRWNAVLVSLFILGAIVAYGITSLPVYEGVDSLPFLFLSGALAVCAMILPGISGSFILVLLGSYKTVLDAVHERKIAEIATVGLGAVIGLLSFARLLKWLFSRFHNGTLAVLSGFILGSLNKIWPWKEVVETRVFEDKVIPVRELNQWPGQYEGDPQILAACLLAFLGFSLIFILERLAREK